MMCIGRPSEWGNPYSHKNGTLAKFKVDSVEEAIQKYEEYLRGNENLMGKIEELRGKVLGCWCARKEPLTLADTPFKCHGQVILKILAESNKQ
jgi:hypothetical protein